MFLVNMVYTLNVALSGVWSLSFSNGLTRSVLEMQLLLLQMPPPFKVAFIGKHVT